MYNKTAALSKLVSKDAVLQNTRTLVDE